MIEFKNVYKSYKNKPVLMDINLKIKSGEFFILIGSSGCGKTTLLKTINKLQTINDGFILMDNVPISNIKNTALRKKIGYVVQEGGLFPHLTVAENISIILDNKNLEKEKLNRHIDNLLRMVNLDPITFRDSYPIQLSGGQKQRVGVARAFANDPDIILMDEPFSALDPVTRAELQDEIYKLQKNEKKTIIFVTHDMDEAIKLADRICIIQNGKIVQCDTPEYILKNPVNSYVEDFIGKNKLWSNPEFIKAIDIMKKNPFKISKERTTFQAVQIMKHNTVDSILVTDENKLIGIIYLKDILNFNDYSIPLEQYISQDYVSVYENTSLHKILNTIDYDISGVIPVINHENVLTGFLTKSILLATLSKQYTKVNEKNDIVERGETI